METSLAAITHSMFKVGDKVRVGLDVEVLKAMQDGHGGWNPRMAEVRGSYLISNLWNGYGDRHKNG